MVRWEGIPDLAEDLLDYLGRQNGTVSHIEMAQYFDRVAIHDHEMTNLDEEFSGLRCARLRSQNGACELLVGFRRVTWRSNILMLVAIKHCAEAEAGKNLCSDPLIQLRLSFGNVKLLKEDRQ